MSVLRWVLLATLLGLSLANPLGAPAPAQQPAQPQSAVRQPVVVAGGNDGSCCVGGLDCCKSPLL